MFSILTRMPHGTSTMVFFYVGPTHEDLKKTFTNTCRGTMHIKGKWRRWCLLELHSVRRSTDERRLDPKAVFPKEFFEEALGGSKKRTQNGSVKQRSINFNKWAHNMHKYHHDQLQLPPLATLAHYSNLADEVDSVVRDVR